MRKLCAGDGSHAGVHGLRGLIFAFLFWNLRPSGALGSALLRAHRTGRFAVGALCLRFLSFFDERFQMSVRAGRFFQKFLGRRAAKPGSARKGGRVRAGRISRQARRFV